MDNKEVMQQMIDTITDRLQGFNIAQLGQVYKLVCRLNHGIRVPRTDSSDIPVLEYIAKDLSNLAAMPYTWEDVYNRLLNGIKLPFNFKETV